MASPDRFFSATIEAGRIRILGLPWEGPWDPARLEWREEPELDILVNLKAGDRKVRTREELEFLVTVPSTPTRFLWIHENLLDDARRLWERTV
jgi:hypothetical protein